MEDAYKNLPTTRVLLWAMGRIRSDILCKAKDQKNVSVDDFALAEYDFWCDILSNSSFFTKDEITKNTEQYKPPRLFVCEAGKIKLVMDYGVSFLRRRL